MSLLKEFREFAIKGNAIDMAVGIVIGAAFGKIVSSLVDNVIMPPIGVLVGGVDFSDLKLVLKEAEGDVAAVTLNYGQFIQTIVDFTIIAFAIFMMLKVINKLKTVTTATETAKGKEAPPVPPADILLLTEIRDLLKQKPVAATAPVAKTAVAKPVAAKTAAAKLAEKTKPTAKPVKKAIAKTQAKKPLSQSTAKPKPTK